MGCLLVAGVLLPSVAVRAFAADDPPVRQASAPQRAARPRVPTLETANRTLAEARRRQALAPTAENERRLAEAYRDAHVFDAALDHFDAAIKLDPRDAAAFEGAARIWRDWGYPNLALPHAYRAVFWAPESAGSHSTLGTVLLKLGLVDAAANRFEQARQLDPAAAFPLNNLCYLELQRSRAPAAVEFCRQAVARDESSQIVRNNLAVALTMSGDLDAAFGVFERGTSAAVAAYNQGLLWLAARQPDRAREAFGRARTADPGFRRPLDRLRQLAFLRKER